MNNLFLRDLCAALVLSFGHFLWMGTVIAIVAALFARRQPTAAARYGAWLVGLIAMAISPFVTLVVLMAMPQAVTTVNGVPASAPAGVVARPVDETSHGDAANDSRRMDALVRPLPDGKQDDIGNQPSGPNEGGRAGVPILQGDRAADGSDEQRPAITNAIQREPVWWREYAPVVTSLYLIGVALMGLRLAFGLWGGRRLRNQAMLITERSLLDALQRQADALGLKLVPAMAYCERVAVPTVLGILKPMILLPVSLASGLAPDQIESVLAHELAHLRRYDHLVNLMQCVIESVLFFHPAVWWVSRRVRDEREHCCDDLVVACGAVPLDYAASLLRVAELSREAERQRGRSHQKSFTAVSLFATGDRPSTLRQRIARLLGYQTELNVWAISPWALFCLATCCVGAIWLLSSMTFVVLAEINRDRTQKTVIVTWSAIVDDSVMNEIRAINGLTTLETGAMETPADAKFSTLNCSAEELRAILKKHADNKRLVALQKNMRHSMPTGGWHIGGEKRFFQMIDSEMVQTGDNTDPSYHLNWNSDGNETRDEDSDRARLIVAGNYNFRQMGMVPAETTNDQATSTGEAAPKQMFSSILAKVSVKFDSVMSDGDATLIALSPPSVVRPYSELVKDDSGQRYETKTKEAPQLHAIFIHEAVRVPVKQLDEFHKLTRVEDWVREGSKATKEHAARIAEWQSRPSGDLFAINAAWTRELPNGGHVQLVGLGCPKEAQQIWWTPNGEPLLNVSPTVDVSQIQQNPNCDVAAIVRIWETGVPRVPAPPKGMIQVGAIFDGPDKFSSPQSQLIIVPVLLDKATGKVSLKIGAGFGPWTAETKIGTEKDSTATLSGLEIKTEPLMESQSFDPATIAPGTAAKLVKSTWTSFAWQPAGDFEFVAEAITAAGMATKEHPVPMVYVNEPRTQMSVTHLTPKADIQHFLIKSRPVHWTEFTNFAIEPAVALVPPLEFEPKGNDQRSAADQKSRVRNWERRSMRRLDKIDPDWTREAAEHGGRIELVAVERPSIAPDIHWTPSGQPVDAKGISSISNIPNKPDVLELIFRVWEPGRKRRQQEYNPPYAAADAQGGEFEEMQLLRNRYQWDRIEVGAGFGPYTNEVKISAKQNATATLDGVEYRIPNINQHNNPTTDAGQAPPGLTVWVIPQGPKNQQEVDLWLVAKTKSGDTVQPARQTDRQFFYRDDFQIGGSFWFDLKQDDIDHFVLQTRPIQWVTFTGIATEPAEALDPPLDFPKAEVRNVDVVEAVPNKTEWSEVVNGLRARAVPVSAGMDEAAIDLGKPVTEFELLDDVTLAVEIQNVSDKPVALRELRYGENFGDSKGKLASDWFGQFLFSIDYFDATGKRIERPQLIPVKDELDIANHGALQTTLEPRNSVKMLLRPNRWISALSQQPIVGKQRAVVRYRGTVAGEGIGILGDVVAPSVEFTVTKRGYRPSGAPAMQMWEEPKDNPELQPDITKQLVWGKPVNGLRAALDVMPESRGKGLSHGTKPKLKLVVQNVSDKPVTLASFMWLSDSPVKAKNANSDEIDIPHVWYSGETPVVRVLLKPQQVVTFDAGNLGLAVTKERADAFEHMTHRRLVAPRGKYTLQATERFGTSFRLEDGKGNVTVPNDGDFKGDLTTGMTPLDISNEIIEGEIVDAVTGKPVEGATVSFKVVKPKTANSEETTLSHMVWGPKSPSKIYFTIPETPEDIAQRPDRDELEVRWGVGSHPDYETYAPDARIPLKEFFHAGPKTARAVLSKIKLTPKKNAETSTASASPTKAVLPDGRSVEFVGITKNTAPANEGWKPDGTPIGDVGYWPSTTVLHNKNTSATYVENGPHPEPDAEAIDLLVRFRGLKEQPSLTFDLPANGASRLRLPLKEPYELRVSTRRRGEPPPGGRWSIPDGEVRIGLTDEPWGKWVQVDPAGKVLTPIVEGDLHRSAYEHVSIVEVATHDRAPNKKALVLRQPKNASSLYAFEIRGIDEDGKSQWVSEWESRGVERTEFEEGHWGLASTEKKPLARYEFRLRPYRHFVTFTGVSLEPGKASDVKVKAETVASIPQDDARVEAAPKRISFAEAKQLVEELGGQCYGDRQSDDPAARVQLNGEKVDDATIRKLAGYPKLKSLWMNGMVSVTDDGLATLAHCTSLENLQLQAPAVTDEGIKHLARLTKLEYLTLSNTKLTDGGLAHVATLPKLKHFSLWSDNVSDAGMQHLARMKSLKNLASYCPKVTNDGLKALAQSASLDFLQFSSQHVTDEGITHLAGLKQLKGLGTTDVRLTDESLKAIGSCANLEYLSLSGTEITDAGLEHLKGLTKVEGLHFYRNRRITGEGLSDLRGLPVKQFTLMGPRTSDKALQQLAAFPAITHLAVGFGAVAPKKDEAYLLTDAGLEHLATMPALAYLSIDGAAITDAGVVVLKQASLETVLCLRCPQLTTAGKKTWQTAAPHVQINGDFHEPRAGRGTPNPALDPNTVPPNSDKDGNPTKNANGDPQSNPAAGSGDPRRTQDTTSPPKELDFLKPYPKLHGLSLSMTEPQFLEIVKQQELKTRKSVNGETVTHRIDLGDGHALIVMFDKNANCSGIQRVRGEDAADQPAAARKLGAPAVVLPDHLNVMAVGFGREGKELMSVATERDVAVRVWDLDEKKLKREVKLESDKHGNFFLSGQLTLSGDRQRVLAILEGKVLIWDATTGKLVKTLELPEEMKHGLLRGLACTPDLSVVACGREPGLSGISPPDAHAIVWDVATGKVLRTVKHTNAVQVHSLALSPDGKLLATGGQQTGTCLWDISTGALVHQWPNNNLSPKNPTPDISDWGAYQILCLRFSPDGQRLAMGDMLELKLMDVKSGKLLFQCDAPFRYGRSGLVFSKDGQLLARTATDKVVPIWSAHTGKLLAELPTEAHDGCFSDDGRSFAVGFSDSKQAVAIWQLQGDAAKAGQAADEASAPASSKTDKQPDAHDLKWGPLGPQDYAAVLANGLKIELVAIAHANVNLADGAKRKAEGWWRPDGTKLDAAPVGVKPLTVTPTANHANFRELVFRVQPQSDELRPLVAKRGMLVQPWNTQALVTDGWSEDGVLQFQIAKSFTFQGDSPGQTSLYLTDLPLVKAAVVDLSGKLVPDPSADVRTKLLLQQVRVEGIEKSATETILKLKSHSRDERVQVEVTAVLLNGQTVRAAETVDLERRVIPRPVSEISSFEIRLRPMTHGVIFNRFAMVPGQKVKLETTVRPLEASVDFSFSLKGELLGMIGDVPMAELEQRLKQFQHDLNSETGAIAIYTSNRATYEETDRLLTKLNADGWKWPRLGIRPRVIECDIIDAVTNKPVSGTTVNFRFLKPKTGDKPEEIVADTFWGPKAPSQLYFSIPDEVMARPDRQEIEVEWSVAQHDDYEPLAPKDRLKLKPFLAGDAKLAVETLSSIKLTPKKKTAAVTSPRDGLDFLKPYPRLHGLSLDMTEPQFLEIVAQQELKARKTVDDKRGKGQKVTYHIALGDGHTLIVMFFNAKCSGIQRVRGDEPDAAAIEGDKPDRKDAAAPTQSFSTETEVVLSMNSLKFMLDLDSGETMDPPATIRPEQKKMDVHAEQQQPYDVAPGLIGLSLRGVKAKPEDWNVTVDDLQKRLASDRAGALTKLPFDPKEVATYFFLTADGTVGVVQLLAQTDEPKGIRLRYKTAVSRPSNPEDKKPQVP